MTQFVLLKSGAIVALDSENPLLFSDKGFFKGNGKISPTGASDGFRAVEDLSFHFEEVCCTWMQ
jgi:hypothetical protein